MKTRLGMFFQHMPPYPGAAALRGASIASGLRARLPEDCDIVVFTTTAPCDEIPGTTILPIGGGEVENEQGNLSRLVGELRMGLRAARRLFFGPRRCRFAVISTPAYLTAALLCVVAVIRRVPYVLELRDVYPQVYAEAGLIRRGGFVYRILNAISRFMYSRARLVIAATAGIRRIAAETSAKASVKLVYNGFPAWFMAQGRAKESTFTVCFHGVLGYFQDVETIIEVARALEGHGVNVVVIGYGRGSNALQAATIPNLKFLGRKGFSETIATVSRCQIGLCLRKGDRISIDAFPVKIWEYLGLGIPMIVTPHCEGGAFVEAHGCGVQLDSGDVSGIVRAILRIRDDRSVGASYIRACETHRVDFTREATGAVAAGLIVDAFELASTSPIAFD